MVVDLYLQRIRLAADLAVFDILLSFPSARINDNTVLLKAIGTNIRSLDFHDAMYQVILSEAMHAQQSLLFVCKFLRVDLDYPDVVLNIDVIRLMISSLRLRSYAKGNSNT